jgi:hypothetical protein
VILNDTELLDCSRVVTQYNWPKSTINFIGFQIENQLNSKYQWFVLVRDASRDAGTHIILLQMQPLRGVTYCFKQCSRNCTVVLRIKNRVSKSYLLCYIWGCPSCAWGAKLDLKALALRIGKIRLFDAGASISLTLEPWRWEWSKIRLPNACASLGMRLRNAGVQKGVEMAP